MKNTPKNKRKINIETKTGLKTERMHQSKQYLSPEIVKQENSYYFE
jgi:hypothetical protein